ncbi:MAG TPA: FMN-binding glutamate synthase family protein [Gemmatimonadaceae bacterium]|nr:FMN-binding glutamate synthase family protein [Gemmatimonadaceae bacterium]
MPSMLTRLMTVEVVIVALVLVVPLVLVLYLYVFDRRQRQHSILRSYPILGRLRYLFESMGPEMRQYFFDEDNDGEPFSRVEFTEVVKSSKYLERLIGFGSKRDFDAPGFYLRNSMFPTLARDMRYDRTAGVETRRYVTDSEGLFTRHEHTVEVRENPWLLEEEDAVVIGPRCEHPFRVRGLVGMSAMSYGSLGDHAIRALSAGLGMAGGSWMNTGEGGLSPHHLSGGVDVICQIGPGKFGYRTTDGAFSFDELRKKAQIPQVKAFELKLAQGAKIRGGHLPGPKVTLEIAAIRGLEPWKDVDSPNRFEEFSDVRGLVEFIEQIRDATGKPVGCKVVMGDRSSLDELAAWMAESGKGPDFITVDGGEGGSGATYSELADSVGLPIASALIIVDDTLRRAGVRDRVTLIASGKLLTPDRQAIALGMGADLVNVARGFMISVGCIGAQRCHTNRCPVGVATTDPRFQQALVVEEKKYRAANFVMASRHGLYTIAAALGLTSPTQIRREHVVYRDDRGRVHNLTEWYPYPAAEQFQQL